MIGLLLWMMMHQAQEPHFTVISPVSRPGNLNIIGQSGESLVSISMEDGSMTYGPHYTPDAAAQVLWETVHGKFAQDVPAVEVEVPPDEVGVCLRSGSDGCRVTDSDGKAVDASEWLHAENVKSYHLYRWSCEDKSRILLTSEDGKKHCIKF